MKAKHITTGREIEILGISKEFGTACFIDNGILCNGLLVSGEWKITDTDSSSLDWKSLHAEAAKDTLCALLIGNEGYHGDGENKMFVEQAIGLADELIKQLKER